MNVYLQLAKMAIEKYITEGKVVEPPANLPKEMLEKKSGVFVTIYKGEKKELRGCIGTYLPCEENIAKEIIRNAIVAATEDYRFGPVRKSELPLLSYSVYLLNPPEKVQNQKELDPKIYGILVKTEDGRSGLLLPDLKGVDTIEKQISIACQKGGIDPVTDKISLYRFSVKKYE